MEEIEVLIICTEGLGDIFLAFSFFKEIRRIYESKEIYVLTVTKNQALFITESLNFIPIVNYQGESFKCKEVYSLNTGSQKFNIITNKIIQFDTVKLCVKDALNVIYTPRKMQSVKEQYLDLLRANGHKADVDNSFILGNLPKSNLNKLPSPYTVLSISKLSYGIGYDEYSHILQALISVIHPEKIVITGFDYNELQIANELEKHFFEFILANLVGRTSIATYISIIENSNRVISFDSSAMHLGDYFNKILYCFVKKHWNYESYLPTISKKWMACIFESKNELTVY